MRRDDLKGLRLVDQETIRFDAEKAEEFVEDLRRISENYNEKADALQSECVRYCDNKQFIGDMADASKEFIDQKQLGLLHEGHRFVQDKLYKRYLDIQDAFRDIVDASPKARIDTDIVKLNKKNFRVYGSALDSDGDFIENQGKYIKAKFEKFLDGGKVTQPDYNPARKAYEELSGDGALLDECVEKCVEFDAAALSSLNNSGLEDEVLDLTSSIIDTAVFLDGMKVNTPDVANTSLGFLPLSTKSGDSAYLNNTLLNNTSLNMNNGAMLLNTAAIPVQIDAETLSGLEEIVIDILKAGAYTIDQIKAVVAQLPGLAALMAADGPLPIGDMIAVGLLTADVILIIVKVADYLWDNNCINESRVKEESDSKEKSKTKDKDQKKGKAKQDPLPKEQNEDNNKSKSSKPNSAKLRRNMKNAGMPEPNFPNAAHHIVAGGAAAAERAREILEGYNIDINDANNGVFLPRIKEIGEGIYHPAMHTMEYYDKVTDLLSYASSREECIEILREIAEELMNGTF